MKYIQSDSFQTEHLNRASYLDIKDVIIALQRSALKCLPKLSQTEVVNNERYNALIEELSSPDWISKLSKVQENVQKIIEERSCTPENSKDLGISLSENLSVGEQRILQRYGLIERSKFDDSGHITITLKAENLSLKDVVKTYLAGRRFNEVHFMCANCFYIDTTIGKGWESKNIAICSPKVHVSIECIIDVSGKNGIDGKTLDRGRQKGKHGGKRTSPGNGNPGSNGKNGTAGESGGNILIRTNEIVHPEQLTLKSCGGKGGDGQNGFNGGDGMAKEGAEEDLRQDKWPKDFAKYFTGNPKDVIEDIITKMSSDGFTIKSDFIGDRGGSSGSVVDMFKIVGGGVAGGLVAGPVGGVAVGGVGLLVSKGLRNMSFYSEGKNGVRLLFSFYDARFSRYGFLLSMASDGKSADGGDAGIGGIGADGGKAGQLILSSWINTLGQEG